MQSQICTWLSENNYCFWRVITKQYTKFRSNNRFIPAGLPDIALIHKGKFIGIEVKRPSRPAPIRDSQDTFRERLQNAGGDYFIVHSLDEVKQLISRYELV